MVGIYVRVSTLQQHDNESYERQEEEGIKFAKAIGEEYKVYKEAKSGRKKSEDDTREEFLHLRKDISLGKVNNVWIIKEDRLSRDTITSLSFLETCKQKKCKFFIDGREQNLFDSNVIFFLTISFGQAQLAGDNIVNTSKVAIPLKSAGSSGVILPPVFFMLVAARESTQPAGMAQAADCSRWPFWARIDIPESEILIA
jgi:hypothetical protein